MDDNCIVHPPKKRRKLNDICGANFLANLPHTNQLEDVTFIVGKEKEKISGNRTIFALQSSVFRAQLYGKMQEAKSNEIIIEDITPQAFAFIKHIFYRIDDELTADIVCDILYLCKKYLLIDLECECYKFIENIDNLNDWWKLIQKQRITTDTNMEDALLRKSKILIKHSDEVATNFDELVKLTPEWMRKLVQCDTFVVSKEEKIWEMCLNYCKKVSSDIWTCTCHVTVKQKMNFFLPYIRFSYINKDYFFDKIETSGILSCQYLYQICKCFVESSTKKYKYESDIVQRGPRTPFFQRFMAEYDIKSLKTESTLLWKMMDGRYCKHTIVTVGWTEPDSRETFGQGIQLANSHDQMLFQNKTVSNLRGSLFTAVIDTDILDSERNVNADHKDNDDNDEPKQKSTTVDLEPDLNDIKSIFKVGSFIECWHLVCVNDGNSCPNNEIVEGNAQDFIWKWIKVKVIDVVKYEWVYLVVDVNQDKKQPETHLIEYYHPWDFTHIRL